MILLNSVFFLDLSKALAAAGELRPCHWPWNKALQEMQKVKKFNMPTLRTNFNITLKMLPKEEWKAWNTLLVFYLQSLFVCVCVCV